MEKIKFSVVTPTYNRAHMVQRAIKSVQNQTTDESIEHIVVDDCSDDNTDDVMEYYKASAQRPIKYLKTEFTGDRVRARNLGMRNATGEWITWLDSDDMYVPYYFEVLHTAISRAPEYDIFNYGGINIHKSYNATLRPTFKPKIEGKGHEIFRAGDIPSGHFIFKRSLLDEIGYLPETNDCWQFAAAIKEQHPEMAKLYTGTQELGNPWGDDYALFYKLTRNHISKPLDVQLYIVWGREEKRLEL